MGIQVPRWGAACAIAMGLSQFLGAQDRLPLMPGYDRYEKLRREISGSIVRANITPRWEEGGTFVYSFGGKQFRYDIAAKKSSPISGGADPEPKESAQQRPARGRQFTEYRSRDGKWIARYKDFNLWLEPNGGGLESALTTEGNAKERIKCGSASWVYGEELGVREAAWWSPDNSRLAYYRFDESEVKDYYLAMDVTKVNNTLDAEPYPKAGDPNPKVALLVYDMASKKHLRIETDSDLGAGTEVGHYVYDVRWSPDGKEVLFNRTNRKQNLLEFCAADPATGKIRLVVRESWPQSWTDNHPPLRYLAERAGEPRRFLWITSSRNGYRNLYLGDLSGKPLKALTQNEFDCVRILEVDEEENRIYYFARSGNNPYLFQLHRVGLDGTGDKRLTDPELHHTVHLSPKRDYFVDLAENSTSPPVARLCDGEGKVLDTVVESDLAKFSELGLKPVERFTFLAADGKTVCYGRLHFPSNFDPEKSYPLVVSVYAGPESGGGAETFETPNAITELGFLMASLDGRGTNGRGKAFLDAVYGKLGVVEIDDQAAGAKALAERPYIDGDRIGIYGTSYGGYASVMCILRHPDVFRSAVASSSVTHWRNYDTIYTERYMGLPWPEENQEGYENGSAMKYARNLKGNLMLFYGTADNNVHPANTYQLAQALQRAGKRFDMMAGPDQGHAGINQNRLWEYFVETLVLPGKDRALARVWNTRLARLRSERQVAARSN